MIYIFNKFLPIKIINNFIIFRVRNICSANFGYASGKQIWHNSICLDKLVERYYFLVAEMPLEPDISPKIEKT